MATIAEFFATRKNQYHKNILGRITRGNPFRGITPMSTFDLGEGDVPTVITQTHMLPTAYPTALTQVPSPSVQQGASDATTSAACNPDSTVIQTGHKERTFRLYSDSFKTPQFCLSDMKRKHRVREQVRFMERALGTYTDVWWSDYHRIQNIAMCDNKFVTNADGAIGEASNTDADHSGVTGLPADYAGWAHLKKIYWWLIRMGVADELAIGTAGGQIVIPLIASPAYIEKFTKSDDGSIDKIRTTIDYYDPKSNLKALGITEAINGIAFIPDLFNVRYGDVADGSAATSGDNDSTSAIDHVDELVAANMIYPTINDTTVTTGVGHKPNPNWMTAANGGIAEYEVLTFLPKGVWEVKYEAVDPTSFGMQNFNPKTDYIGTFNFINAPTFGGTNDRGNMGYYLADIRAAAKPGYTDLGVSLLTKALD